MIFCICRGRERKKGNRFAHLLMGPILTASPCVSRRRKNGELERLPARSPFSRGERKGRRRGAHALRLAIGASRAYSAPHAPRGKSETEEKERKTEAPHFLFLFCTSGRGGEEIIMVARGEPVVGGIARKGKRHHLSARKGKRGESAVDVVVGQTAGLCASHRGRGKGRRIPTIALCEGKKGGKKKKKGGSSPSFPPTGFHIHCWSGVHRKGEKKNDRSLTLFFRPGGEKRERRSRQVHVIRNHSPRRVMLGRRAGEKKRRRREGSPAL